MLLFEEVCKTMHKRAVTKMQKTAGRVIKGSWLSQQNLFRFMASSPASFTCYATQQLTHQRPLPSEMPETNVHARGCRGGRTLECLLRCCDCNWLLLPSADSCQQLTQVQFSMEFPCSLHDASRSRAHLQAHDAAVCVFKLKCFIQARREWQDDLADG